MVHPFLLSFTKLHGLGNDFVLLDSHMPGVAHWLDMALSQKRLINDICLLADRKRGIGCDQLLVLRPSARVHAALDIYNTDGSRAEMCGNGLRAAALYLWSHGHGYPDELIIETDAGDRKARRLRGEFIETEMGVPRLPKIPTEFKNFKLQGTRGKLPFLCVNVGNPHVVFFLPSAVKIKIAEWGPFVENHRAFPQRTNAEFVHVKNKNLVKARVWERGVGETEACGTGGVAVAVAALQLKLCASPVSVQFPGGVVEITWAGPGTIACLRGTAEESYTGTFLLKG